ncbi:MAG TPA: VOC family protein [bacterium]|nr:VOC family protein [bacterium]
MASRNRKQIGAHGGAAGSDSARRKRAAAICPQPLIAVADVQASSRWYQRLLGARPFAGVSDHAHLYQRLYCGERLILQLHLWDEEEHPNLMHADAAPHGHGVLLWFEVADFDAALERLRGLQAQVLLQPHVNPNAQHREVWVRDPDGYVVVLASPDGEAPA